MAQWQEKHISLNKGLSSNPMRRCAATPYRRCATVPLNHSSCNHFGIIFVLTQVGKLNIFT
jgi:hypothetical protein